jgi:hypothetical protein
MLKLANVYGEYAGAALRRPAAAARDSPRAHQRSRPHPRRRADRQSRHPPSYEIVDTLKALNRERGVTIVMVTHEPDIARYADRTVAMRDGRIVSDERHAASAATEAAVTATPAPEPVALTTALSCIRPGALHEWFQPRPCRRWRRISRVRS